ncbi:isoprenylcysteine carboxylmethyltransferase family protein [Streptomyces mirabilis]|nr:isoprenylcysteine carboxylmethyltransferase family protein [Streptomyces mirabilis]
MNVALTITLWGWIAAENVLQARQRRRSGRTERTEWFSFVVFVVLIISGLALAPPIRLWVPSLSYSTHDLSVRAAVLVTAWAGIALRVWAIITLGRFFRGTVHIQQGHEVVSSGPYRWMRHPSYSGMLLAGLALALPLDNAAAWLVFTACALTAVAYRVRVEERMLLNVLGEEYRSYAARTHRLIPGVW